MQGINVKAWWTPHKVRSRVGMKKAKDHPDNEPRLVWLMDNYFQLWAFCQISDDLSLSRGTRHNEIKLNIVNITKNMDIPLTSVETIIIWWKTWREPTCSPNISRKVNGRLLRVVSRLQLTSFNQEEPRQSFTSFKEDLLINAGS